jgi:tripeptide aminopeptidase
MRIISLIATAFLFSHSAAAFSLQCDAGLAAEPPAAGEIARLAGDPTVQEAMAAIAEMQPQILEDLVTITEVPAPPFGEAERAELVAGMFEETGFGTVRLDEAGNVIAERKGRQGDKRIALLAHIDSVFPEGTDVSVRQVGDAYAAPGIGDNARGVVALLELARAIEGTGIETDADILLVGVVGEEGLGDLRGARHLFREDGEAIDTAIVIDGTGDARMVTSAIGSNRYRVTYEGPGGHSWSDFGAPNPHHALGRAIQLFADAARPVTQEGPKSSFSVGRIEGGTSINAIPFASSMEVDMRSGDPEKLESLDRIFRVAVQRALALENEAATGGEPITLKLEEVGRRPAAQGDPSASLVRHAAAAIRHEGLEPVATASSTDANIPLSLGIPAVTLARGGVSEGAHSKEEIWRDENTPRATRIALLTLLAEAGY